MRRSRPFIPSSRATAEPGALIQMGLRRRGLVQRILPPVSLVLATWSRDYEAGLMTTRYDGPAEGEAAHAGINHWGATFASARRHSALDRLLSVLAGAPVLTVAAAVDLTGRSHQAVNRAMAQLVQARILRQTTAGRRNRAFEAPGHCGIHQPGTAAGGPLGDTRAAPPAGPVPAQPRTPARHP